MFWDRFYQLSIKQNTKPNPVAKDLGISSGVLTKWKSGGIPNGETLTKIADYFDVSVDYLLERTDESDLSTKKQAVVIDDSLSKEEMKMIITHLCHVMSAKDLCKFSALALQLLEEQLEGDDGHRSQESDQ